MYVNIYIFYIFSTRIEINLESHKNLLLSCEPAAS